MDGIDDPVHDDKSFTGERIPKRRRANKTWRDPRKSVKPGICRAIHISTSSDFENRSMRFRKLQQDSRCSKYSQGTLF